MEKLRRLTEIVIEVNFNVMLKNDGKEALYNRITGMVYLASSLELINGDEEEFLHEAIELPLDKMDSIAKSILKNMFNEIIKLNRLSESLSSIQKLCLLKYLPHDEKNNKINNRLNRISKNDAENLFNSDLEYDVNKK